MAGKQTWTYDQSTEDALFKTAYGKHNAKAFNQRSPLYGRIKKKTNFKGKEMVSSIRLSYGGGRGSGKLPRASRALYKQIKLTTKKLYHRLSIDQETFQASKDSVSAFVNMAKEPMEVARVAFSNLLERQIVLGDLKGSGLLGTRRATLALNSITDTNGVQGVGAKLTVADFVSSAESLEEGDVVDLYQGGDRKKICEVTGVAESGELKLTVLKADAGIQAVANNDATELTVYLQNSKDKELEGLQGILKATPGADASTVSKRREYKGIEIGKRWQAHIQAAPAEGSDFDPKRIKRELNKAILQIVKRCGEIPTVLMCNHDVYTKLLDSFEDIKRVQIPARGKALKGQVGYGALEYVSAQGTIPVVFNRYVPTGEMYLLNEDKIELVSRAAPQWFNRDGTVFLRENDEDTYEARYGCFSDLFVQPFYQGIITGI